MNLLMLMIVFVCLFVFNLNDTIVFMLFEVWFLNDCTLFVSWNGPSGPGLVALRIIEVVSVLAGGAGSF